MLVAFQGIGQNRFLQRAPLDTYAPKNVGSSLSGSSLKRIHGKSSYLVALCPAGSNGASDKHRLQNQDPLNPLKMLGVSS